MVKFNNKAIRTEKIVEVGQKIFNLWWY